MHVLSNYSLQCMHYSVYKYEYECSYICIATSAIYVQGGSCTVQLTTASLCELHPQQMPGDVDSTPCSKACFSIAYFEAASQV